MKSIRFKTIPVDEADIISFKLSFSAIRYVKEKLNELINVDNYFERDQYHIVDKMRRILEDILRKDYLTISQLKEKGIEEIEGSFIIYNSDSGYSLKENDVKNWIEMLFYLPERINEYYRGLIGEKKIRISNPLQQQIIFPLATEFYKRKRKKGDQFEYTQKDALRDAFNEFKKDYNYIENELWFIDTANLIENDIDKLVDTFRKFDVAKVNKKLKEKEKNKK